MIACDTDVLVRLLVGDDASQTALAQRLFAQATVDEPVFISTIVLVETWWVTTRSYGIAPERVADSFDGLCSASDTRIEARESVLTALRAVRSGADFADALIAETATKAGSTDTLTFDHGAANRAGMTSLDESYFD